MASDLPFTVHEVEHPTGMLICPNGSLLGVPKTELGQAWAMACARAVVDARTEWARPA